MILNFRNRATKELFHGIDSKAARTTLPAVLRPVAERKLVLLDVAHDLQNVGVPPGNYLESLKRDWKAFHSIRIIMIPKNRLPVHPGEILLEEFLKPLGMSQVIYFVRCLLHSRNQL
jgi:proteic killer suppression protein